MGEACLQSNHPTGWHARLDLAFAARDQGTVLRENRHSGPLRLQRPLYPEPSVCHAVILHPPGGVVGGDRLEIHAGVEENAAALITTPGAAKFYRSNGEAAAQENVLRVAPGGNLEWLPQETIVYPGAEARCTTRIDLEENAGFMGWEILCLGLPACGHPFDGGSLETRLGIYRNGRPLFLDRLRVQGADDLRRPVGLRGATVTGVFVAAGCTPEMPGPLREIVAARAGLTAGITLMEDLLVARYLGGRSAEVKELFQALWTWLRPRVLGRVACAPRIWET